MRTWLQFSQNLFYKIIIGVLLIEAHLAFSQSPLSIPEKKDYPGHIQTFEELIQIDQKRNATKNNSNKEQFLAPEEFEKIGTFEIDEDTLNSLILYSSPSYLKLASVNSCRLFDVLVNQLLKDHRGALQTIRIVTEEKEKKKVYTVNAKDFALYQIKKSCPPSVEALALFKLGQIDKVLKKAEFPSPSSLEHCSTVYLAWLNEAQTPYYCQIHDILKNRSHEKNYSDVAKILRRHITPEQIYYLDILCENLNTEERFCQQMMDVSFWSKISMKQKSDEIIKFPCQKIMDTTNWNESILKACIAKLNQQPDICHVINGAETGLAPHQNCKMISLALGHARLSTGAEDCPGMNDEQTLVNFSRLLNHTGFGEMKSPATPCSAQTTENLFRFNEKFENLEAWTSEACYDDPVKLQEICRKTFLSNNQKHPNSIVSIIAEILQITRGADQSIKCNLLSDKQYNPLLLEYKSGCQVIYNEDQCFPGKCPLKIRYNDREISHVKMKRSHGLEYFPSAMTSERTSLNYLLSKSYQKESVKIINLTSMTKFLKQNPQSIIHGIGCAELIHPTFYKMQTIGQCTPLPYLITGIMKNSNDFNLVLQSSLESASFPRLVPWSYVYHATKIYQDYHPLKLWTMYGIR